MKFEEAQALQRRIERTQEALESRLESRSQLFRPLLVAWLGEGWESRFVNLRDVKLYDARVELIYGWYQHGEHSRDYSLTLSREICESPNAEADVAALRKAEDAKQEAYQKARRIAQLKSELESLKP